METVNFGNLSISVARPGTKASTSSRPELVVTPTFNKLDLNPLASQKLGLEAGDYVTLLVNGNATTVDEMYLITKGIGDEGQSKLASVGNKSGTGRKLTFSYSGVYSKMLQGKVDAIEMSAEGLSELGLMEKRVTQSDNTAYSATKKVHFGLGEGIEVEGFEDVVYPLINPKYVDYNPRTAGEDDDND